MSNTQFRATVLAVMVSAVGFAATPWESYLELPSPANAAAVQEVTYSDPPSFNPILWDELLILQTQVFSSDQAAVSLAFRLLARSDGHFSEELCVMLGRLIRIDPALFLQELKSHPEFMVRLDGLLGNHGGAYVDRFAAQRYETERRIEVLMSVTDPGLRHIRDRCVAELRTQLDALLKVAP
jgi:hypothetical protein